MGKLSISKMSICGIFLLINGKFSLLRGVPPNCQGTVGGGGTDRETSKTEKETPKRPSGRGGA